MIDTNALEGDQSSPRSYVSLSSLTMGRLDEEAKFMNDTGLVCGRSDGPDFANYVVRWNSKAILFDLVDWDCGNMLINLSLILLPTIILIIHDYSPGNAEGMNLVVRVDMLLESQLSAEAFPVISGNLINTKHMWQIFGHSFLMFFLKTMTCVCVILYYINSSFG